jgi:hypothetical protein
MAREGVHTERGKMTKELEAIGGKQSSGGRCMQCDL